MPLPCPHRPTQFARPTYLVSRRARHENRRPERGTRMNTNTHPFVPEEIMAFVDSELSAGSAQSVSAHIDQCADCRELSASLHSSSEALSNWTVPPSPVNGELEERVRIAPARNSALDKSLSSKVFMLNKRWT